MLYIILSQGQSQETLSSHQQTLANRVECQARGKLAGIGIRYKAWQLTELPLLFGRDL